MSDVSYTRQSSEETGIISTRIPPGGRKGQILTKASDRSYDIKWAGVNGSANCGCESMSVVDIIRIILH